MERIGSRYVLFALLLFAISLSGCATLSSSPTGTGDALEPPLSDEGVLEETIPMFLMKDEATGIIVQYSLIKVVRQGEDLESPRIYSWIDPREEHVLEPFTEIIFFKVEVFNPTGREIFFEQRILLDKFEDSVVYAGGNVENSVFNFPVPLHTLGKRNTMKVAVIFEDEDKTAKEFVTGEFVFLLPSQPKPKQ